MTSRTLSSVTICRSSFFFFFQAEDGIRFLTVTGVQPCALPICGVRLGAHAGLEPEHAEPLEPGAECRSEEHTSELQSQSNLVCRLLLEKKKKHKIGTTLLS